MSLISSQKVAVLVIQQWASIGVMLHTCKMPLLVCIDVCEFALAVAAIPEDQLQS